MVILIIGLLMALLPLDALALPPVEALLAADLDGDGDADLAVRTADDRLHALANDGGEVGGLLKVRLLSLMSSSGAVGSRVELRRGGDFASRNVQREWPVELGLNGHERLDSGPVRRLPAERVHRSVPVLSPTERRYAEPHR